MHWPTIRLKLFSSRQIITISVFIRYFISNDPKLKRQQHRTTKHAYCQYVFFFRSFVGLVVFFCSTIKQQQQQKQFEYCRRVEQQKKKIAFNFSVESIRWNFNFTIIFFLSFSLFTSIIFRYVHSFGLRCQFCILIFFLFLKLSFGSFASLEYICNKNDDKFLYFFLFFFHFNFFVCWILFLSSFQFIYIYNFIFRLPNAFVYRIYNVFYMELNIWLREIL